MSVSLHVLGVKDPTEEYSKKVAVWKACEAAGVEIPAEVLEFFDGEEPDSTGMSISFGYDTYPQHPSASSWTNDYESGLEIDLSGLPEGVTRIRAYLS